MGTASPTQSQFHHLSLLTKQEASAFMRCSWVKCPLARMAFLKNRWLRCGLFFASFLTAATSPERISKNDKFLAILKYAPD
jgi:hypothetical protein